MFIFAPLTVALKFPEVGLATGLVKTDRVGLFAEVENEIGEVLTCTDVEAPSA